ncbi:vacuolar iron transporter 1 [Podospora australis]|uniref:Vacuolar iron transporter 1 n=1 Tax=Podospora australis TaxID=1536484 RepID=A0AAN7ALA3_9PEZI|nr:vacuolar iron transporter 1 [Podospora australis]
MASPSLSRKLTGIIRGGSSTTSRQNLPVYETIPIEPPALHRKEYTSIKRLSDDSVDNPSSSSASTTVTYTEDTTTTIQSRFPTTWPFSSPRISLTGFLSNFTLGFADGLTVPFALTAGLSSLGNTRTVIYAGMAEICAGSISMGIGGYLAARPSSSVSSSAPSSPRPSTEDSEATAADEKELDELLSCCDRCKQNKPVRGAEGVTESPIVAGLSVSLGYLLGGILPLFPYFFVGSTDNVYVGLGWSFAVCVIALFVFGFGKDFVVSSGSGGHNGRNDKRRRVKKAVWEGLQMVALGSIAAIAAVLCVKVFDGLV